MFPAAILFGLAELLIPELARCAAANSHTRIRYLVRRSLKVSVLYGCVFGALMVLLSDSLCMALYGSLDAAYWLRRYAFLIPMLYCDAITDAMTKGLGQQKACVRYNILTSFMDVALLFLLLPRYGMRGYYFSFLVTHALNFMLSLRRLVKISGIQIRLHAPIRTLMSCGIGLGAVIHLGPVTGCVCCLLIMGCLLVLWNVIGQEDLAWIKGLIRKK